MVFRNHSCEPNIVVQGQIVFVALRHIMAGEEVTHDWATTDDDDYASNAAAGLPNAKELSPEKIGSGRICSKNIAACSPGTYSRNTRSHSGR